MSSVSSLKPQDSFTSSSSSTATSSSSMFTASVADDLRHATADLFRDTFSNNEAQAFYDRRDKFDELFCGVITLLRKSSKAIHRKQPLTGLACAIAAPVAVGSAGLAMMTVVGTLGVNAPCALYLNNRARHPKPDSLRKAAILNNFESVLQNVQEALQRSAYEVLKTGQLDPTTLEKLRTDTLRGLQAFETQRKGTELHWSAQLDNAGKALQATVSQLPVLLVDAAYKVLVEKAKAEWTTHSGRAQISSLTPDARGRLAEQWTCVLTWLESLDPNERKAASQRAKLHTQSLAKKFDVKGSAWKTEILR